MPGRRMARLVCRWNSKPALLRCCPPSAVPAHTWHGTCNCSQVYRRGVVARQAGAAGEPPPPPPPPPPPCLPSLLVRLSLHKHLRGLLRPVPPVTGRGGKGGALAAQALRRPLAILVSWLPRASLCAGAGSGGCGAGIPGMQRVPDAQRDGVGPLVQAAVVQLQGGVVHVDCGVGWGGDEVRVVWGRTTCSRG